MVHTQVVAALASVVVVVGLLRAHRVVVREYLLPEIDGSEDAEE